jgi:Holliday junction resolvasome RuvABC DNA-binding subunit
LVLELREKLPKLGAMKQAAKPATTLEGDRAKLLGALVNMGYKPNEAEPALEPLSPRIGREPISDLLREALAALSG